MDLNEKKILLDTAAVFVVESGFDPETADLSTIVSKCIGATNGGVSVTATPDIREVEHDGKMERKEKGMERIVGWNVSASATAMELTDTNLTSSLLEKDDTGTKFIKYTPKSGILQDTDYSDLLVIGRAADGQKMIVVIRDTFNNQGFSLTTESKNEGKMEMAYDGHYTIDIDVLSDEEPKAPFEIYYGK